jgi:hypothetical protein
MRWRQLRIADANNVLKCEWLMDLDSNAPFGIATQSACILTVDMVKMVADAIDRGDHERSHGGGMTVHSQRPDMTP